MVLKLFVESYLSLSCFYETRVLTAIIANSEKRLNQHSCHWKDSILTPPLYSYNTYTCFSKLATFTVSLVNADTKYEEISRCLNLSWTNVVHKNAERNGRVKIIRKALIKKICQKMWTKCERLPKIKHKTKYTAKLSPLTLYQIHSWNMIKRHRNCEKRVCDVNLCMRFQYKTAVYK